MQECKLESLQASALPREAASDLRALGYDAYVSRRVVAAVVPGGRCPPPGCFFRSGWSPGGCGCTIVNVSACEKLAQGCSRGGECSHQTRNSRALAVGLLRASRQACGSGPLRAMSREMPEMHDKRLCGAAARIVHLTARSEAIPLACSSTDGPAACLGASTGERPAMVCSADSGHWHWHWHWHWTVDTGHTPARRLRRVFVARADCIAAFVTGTGKSLRTPVCLHRRGVRQQPATSSQQPATSSQQPATSSQQPATSSQQPATSNQQPPTASSQQPAAANS
ncbi:hypothetical protein PMIN01_01279 [Paraphaeosphaeria minitans]|uniref:Uncharacterized protein n=1 Tax=Paraphaeosphaeria minitans TaxID=565426 RepID=A0A9P6GWC2_9PLEO|nr:hypothetical protein PMIN01_01279 [Paraphaeosphaeria minitans]